MSNFYKLFVNFFINESHVSKSIPFEFVVMHNMSCIYIYIDVIDVIVDALFLKRK